MHENAQIQDTETTIAFIMTTDIIEEVEVYQVTMDTLDTLLRLIQSQLLIQPITMLRPMLLKKTPHIEKQINRFTISGQLLNRGESMNCKEFRNLTDFRKSGEMRKRESMHLLPGKIQLKTIIKVLEHLHMLKDGGRHIYHLKKKLMLMLKLQHLKQVMMKDFTLVLLQVSLSVAFFCF